PCFPTVMTPSHPIDRYLARYPNGSALAYLALGVVLLMTALFALSDIVERYQALNGSSDLLAVLAKPLLPFPPNSGEAQGAIPTGPPFLEGETVTVASAALLQRVTTAISRVGGNIVSSEVMPQGAPSKDRLVRIIVSCELRQDDLQRLLYDIEAGMPFLLITQFVAEPTLPETPEGKMRVLLGVSGLWKG